MHGKHHRRNVTVKNWSDTAGTGVDRCRHWLKSNFWLNSSRLAYVSDLWLHHNDWRSVVILFPLVFDLGLPRRLLLTETVVCDGVPFNRVVWHKNRLHHGCRLYILHYIVPHDIVHIDVLRCGLRGAHLRVRVRDKSECTVNLWQRGWHGLGPESKRSRSLGGSEALVPPSLPILHAASPWLQHAAAPQRHRVCFRPHTDQNLWRQSSCMPSTLATVRYGSVRFPTQQETREYVLFCCQPRPLTRAQAYGGAV
jgi:hypothetical protein